MLEQTLKSPTVTIGMPVFNGEKFIEQTLISILAQSFEDFEVVICDNASTDKTEAICRNFAKSDSRIRYYRNDTNLGAAKNYNRTFELSGGKYFKWASHDDICDKDYLKKCLQLFENSANDVVLCYPKTVLINEDGQQIDKYQQNEIRSSNPAERLRAVFKNFWLCMCNPVFGLIRSSAVRATRKIGNFSSADVVFLAELSLLGKFCQVPEYLFFRRVHPDMSRLGDRSDDEVAQWIDPETKGKLVLLKCRFLCEFLKSIKRSKLNFLEKCACYEVVSQEWLGRYYREIGGECKTFLRHKLKVAGRF